MDCKGSRYSRYAIVREMCETPSIIRAFDCSRASPVAQSVRKTGRLFMTGEGSSRIFPANNAITNARRLGLAESLATDGGRQAMEYDLSGWTVLAASNSGKTKEVVELLGHLKRSGCDEIFGLTATPGTPVIELSRQGFVLGCGKEHAVGATKSVVEQALFSNAVVGELASRSLAPKLAALAEGFEAALAQAIDPSIIDTIAGAETLYFAGRNDGVAQELTLKANEIARKKADYLEGTYAVHGIEEVMDPNDCVVAIEPFEAEFSKFEEVLVTGVGLKVVAISSHPTPFPTIRIPQLPGLGAYVELACGWSLLVEAGLALEIDLDKPVRARKIGNAI